MLAEVWVKKAAARAAWVVGQGVWMVAVTVAPELQEAKTLTEDAKKPVAEPAVEQVGASPAPAEAMEVAVRGVVPQHPMQATTAHRSTEDSTEARRDRAYRRVDQYMS